jgi:hypothetical protein
MVVVNGLMPPIGSHYVSPATFRDAYPGEIRRKVLDARA